MALNGKVAIVTGSAVGIGRAFAVALAEEGVDVAGFDVRAAENLEMAREVQSRRRKGVAIACDVADRNEVRRAVAETLQTFGCVDILVNNAGVFELGTMAGVEFDKAADSYERQLAVNARGTFLCTLAVVPIMRRQGGGAIVNVISNHVHRTRYAAAPVHHAYDASKWAQWSLNETIALELKDDGIRVNGLCPAATDTPMLRSLIPEPTAEIIGSATGIPSLMMPADVALALVNILKWGPDGPVGQAPLIITREDAEKLAKFHA